MFWLCPKLDEIKSEAIKATQKYKGDAVDGYHKHGTACLWFRGLLPLGLVAVPPLLSLLRCGWWGLPGAGVAGLGVDTIQMDLGGPERNFPSFADVGAGSPSYIQMEPPFHMGGSAVSLGTPKLSRGLSSTLSSVYAGWPLTVPAYA